MNKKLKALLLSLIFIMILALGVYYVISHEVAVLYPKGMIGIKERDLILTSSILMLIVVIPVFVLTFYFAWKYRESNEKARHEPDWEHNTIAEMCWWGVPFVIVVILATLCWQSSHELSPFKPIDSSQKPLKIQVVALDWKWLFIYPEEGIASINFIAFPENRPLAFEITADAPMNSFWIPELGGMIYAMPAMRSKLYLVADHQGEFRGASANISGRGFAGMNFKAKSTSVDEYLRWLGSVKSSGTSLDFSFYEKELLKPSEYNPAEFFSLGDEDLFEKILQKYMTPQK